MIRLDLPWPPSTNTAYANVRGRRVKTKRAREYASSVSWIVRRDDHATDWRIRAGNGWAPRLAVRIDAHPPDRRRRDLANTEKLAIDAIFDYLQLDDSLIDDLHLVRRDLDRPDGRLVITIQEAA